MSKRTRILLIALAGLTAGACYGAYELGALASGTFATLAAWTVRYMGVIDAVTGFLAGRAYQRRRAR